jgi:thymidylate kinase
MIRQFALPTVVPDAMTPGTDDPTRRAIATTSCLFDALKRAGVRYCHFKSNAHLLAGLEGLTDLDLLCDSQQVELTEQTLARHGFRRFPAHPSRGYLGVEDYFGIDQHTGRLLHLHLHYRLIVGERFLKNYRLPWESEFLERRVFDESAGVYVADPALEWLLLVCRAALKIRWRDRALAVVGSRRGESGGLRGEHFWLGGRVDRQAPKAHAEELLDAGVGELVELALADDLAFGRLKRLRRELLQSEKVFRGYRRIPALGVRWSRELRWMVGTVNRRYLRRPFPYSRSAPGGGTVVAVIGSDGAGKSSVSGLLYSWLTRKLDVIPIYFGSGDGQSSILRWPLKVILDLTRGRSNSPSRDPEQRRTRDIGFARAVWAVVLAREKRSKLRKAIRARERGFIVICDRYPQTQVDGVNDGPLLWRWRTSTSRLRRALARWEDRIYTVAASVPPDVVVRLLVTPETAAARRPGDDPAELEFRTQLVRGLRFDTARFGVIDIDADADLDSVVLEVKRQLWPAL